MDAVYESYYLGMKKTAYARALENNDLGFFLYALEKGAPFPKDSDIPLKFYRKFPVEMTEKRFQLFVANGAVFSHSFFEMCLQTHQIRLVEKILTTGGKWCPYDFRTVILQQSLELLKFALDHECPVYQDDIDLIGRLELGDFLNQLRDRKYPIIPEREDVVLTIPESL